MNYQPHIDAVIGLARHEGCRVVVRGVPFLKGGSTGLFYPTRMPFIEIAVGHPHKRPVFYVMVHELMHYRQHRSGVPDAVKNLKSHALNRTLMCEYEAEKMTAWFVYNYGLPGFNVEKYTEASNRYMQAIKWYRINRDAWIDWPGRVLSVRVPSTWWTDAELIEPLSERDKAAFERYWKRYGQSP